MPQSLCKANYQHRLQTMYSLSFIFRNYVRWADRRGNNKTSNSKISAWVRHDRRDQDIFLRPTGSRSLLQALVNGIAVYGLCDKIEQPIQHNKTFLINSKRVRKRFGEHGWRMGCVCVCLLFEGGGRGSNLMKCTPKRTTDTGPTVGGRPFFKRSKCKCAQTVCRLRHKMRSLRSNATLNLSVFYNNWYNAWRQALFHATLRRDH